MFVGKIRKYIAEKQLFAPSDKILVALSGGADSVALLRVLRCLGYECVCAHCNFRLRGEESDRDEAFVRALCREQDVPLYVTHFDTAVYARRNKLSIEMAARELRYEWFEQIRRETGARVTAVAHHRDDSVETFLLNMVRGTGINGLKGIAPVNGRVVRPLLAVGRKEILDYLASLEQPYVTDRTNLEDVYARNKVRLNVLPMLREINPAADENIAETAGRLTEVAEIYRHAIDEACRRVTDGEGRIHIARLQKEVSPQCVLFELLHPKGFNAAQLKDIYRSLSHESGRLFYSDSFVLLRDREYLVLRLRNKAEGKMPVLHQSLQPRDAGFVIPRDKCMACLDADKVKEPLTLRKWQSGDRFVPFGMKGFKSVRDYLRDHKFSLFEKENQYVVCVGNEIVWLVNERPDGRFCVSDDTRTVLLLSVSAEE